MLVSHGQTQSHTHAVWSLLMGGLLCAETVKILRSGSGQVTGAKVMGLEGALIRICELDKSSVNTPADGGAEMCVNDILSPV